MDDIDFFANPKPIEEKKVPEPKMMNTQLCEKVKAKQLKEEGTALQKAKKLDDALKKWQEAYEVDSTDAVHLSNIAAIYLETKENDKVIEICEQAIELFEVHSTELQLRVRIQQRLGTAYLNKKEFKKAVEIFEKSLLEKRTDPVKELKLKAENEIKAQEVEQMIGPAEQEFKEIAQKGFSL